MLTLIIFLLVLSILVLVHELGHFLVAKKIGVKVEEFGLGYPPRIFGKKIGETIYSLNTLPFGGFVKLYGEEGGKNSSGVTQRGSHELKGLRNAFFARSKVERSLILLAGVAMNFLLGVVVISFLFTRGVYVPAPGVRIEKVLPNTPAEKAGLNDNDIINSINGQKVNSPQELIDVTKSKLGETVVLLIKRCPQNNDCQLLAISLIPRQTYPDGEGAMGIGIMPNLELKTYSFWQAPILGTREAFKLSWFILKGVASLLWHLVSSARVPTEVAGPIGIYKITGQAVQRGGFLGVLQLIGLLSLNLAVVNVLPIPALDGGRFFLILVEIVIGKKKTAQIEKMVQGIGVALIFALIILITINDISRLTLVKSLLQNIKLPF